MLRRYMTTEGMMGREFDSRRLDTSFFRACALESYMNGYDRSVLPDTSTWQGEGPGEHYCYYEACEIRRAFPYLNFGSSVL